ncbi:MAG: YgiT-type zinc finger protein [Ruminiclostridium sp.]|nr:YgiT-type zinc finger protein [Ruminiclostridium sp.]
MVKIIKCLFCGKPTTLHNINVQKKIRGKVITLSNAPVYYCQPCKETFQAKETQDVFRYIYDNNLDEKLILFNYDDISQKLN